MSNLKWCLLTTFQPHFWGRNQVLSLLSITHGYLHTLVTHVSCLLNPTESRAIPGRSGFSWSQKTESTLLLNL